jgi:hypothetical protein
MGLSQLSTILFGVAIMHTFAAPWISAKWKVELILGFWALVFLFWMMFERGFTMVFSYLAGLSFKEPLFVFVFMIICASKPILWIADKFILRLSNLLHHFFKLDPMRAEVFVLLAFGPLLGSLMTEPAAMTLVALFLRKMIRDLPSRALYALVGILFVNISVGGAMTPFAAPPILMVALKWGWSFETTLSYFAWRSFLICLVNTTGFLMVFKKDLQTGMSSLRAQDLKDSGQGLKIHEAFLVAVFLASLVVFGELQKWWLQPLLAHLSNSGLFFGATALTSIVDNAALTYLGSQVEGLSDFAKYAIVAGALAGGGLTILANAPNPVGYSILISKFPGKKMSHLRLFQAAMIPTLVAVLLFWFI